MTRTEMIERVGIKNVEQLELVNCELTNRCGGNGLMHGDQYLEFCATIKINYDGLSDDQIYNLPVGWECSISAYFEADNEIEQRAIDCDCGIWDIADIEVSQYEID